MKKIVTSLAVIVAFVFSILIVYTMSGREYRENEITQSTIAAMESAMKILSDANKYKPVSNEEFEAAYISAFLESVDSKNEKYSMNIVTADYQTGLLRAEVVVDYKHPNGNEGSVSVDRTMILENSQKTLPEKMRISFSIGDNIYREYYLEIGENLNAPKIPNGVTGTIWKKEDETTINPGENIEVSGTASYILQ